MKKQIWIIVAAVVLIVLIECFHYLVPANVFPEDTQLTIFSIDKNVWEDEEGKKVTSVDVTEKFDVEALESCLLLMQRSRIKTGVRNYQMKNVKYALNGICNGRPVHILLGTAGINLVYEDGVKGGYQIRSPEVWLQIIELAGK